MRIEGLDPQEIIVFALVGFQPIYSPLERLGCGKLILGIDCSTIPIVLGRPPTKMFRLQGTLDIRSPNVMFLSSIELPGAELGMVVLSSNVEIVVMIGFQSAVDVVLPQ
jgi:hypothetical protein